MKKCDDEREQKTPFQLVVRQTIDTVGTLILLIIGCGTFQAAELTGATLRNVFVIPLIGVALLSLIAGFLALVRSGEGGLPRQIQAFSNFVGFLLIFGYLLTEPLLTLLHDALR